MSGKPHICKLPGFGGFWFAFTDRAHRDKAVAEIRNKVPEWKRRHDALTWGVTFEQTLNRVLAPHGYQ